MMYASKTPRDIRGNTDPKPWVLDDGTRLSLIDSVRLDRDVAFAGKGEVAAYDPRPEFDHVQHNEPNPILVAFRRCEDARNSFALRQWCAFLSSGWDGSICRADLNQQNHAYRVLSRLAGLS